MYVLKDIGLRQLPCGSPEKVERVICEPKEEVKERFLFEKKKK